MLSRLILFVVLLPMCFCKGIEIPYADAAGSPVNRAYVFRQRSTACANYVL
jgi:hypothetical protein